MRRCLVVANETLGGERLHEEVRRRVRDGPCRFHVVVPARSPAERPVAERRLTALLSRLHGMGVLATGEVGGGGTEHVLAEVLGRETFDDVIGPPLPV